MIARGVIRVLKAVEQGGARRDLLAGRVRRILLVETTRFGDLMAVLAVLSRFRAAFPNASITLLVHPDHISVLPALGVTGDVITFPWPADPIGCGAAMVALHERNFDLACSMSPSVKNALLTLLAPAAMRAGYLSGESSLTSFRNELLVESTGLATAPLIVPAGTNLYIRAARVADLLGCPEASHPAVKIPVSLEAEWPALAASIGLDTRRPFVVIHPFAAWKFREWPILLFRGLVDLLNKALPEVQVVLLGTAGDILRASGGATPLPSGIIVLGTRDWAGSASVISHAAAFVGTDSGPLHLASALGRRVVGLFGPAAPKFTASPRPGRKDLFSELPCSPCDQRQCLLPDASCMSRISGRQVFDVVAPFFAQTGALVANG